MSENTEFQTQFDSVQLKINKLKTEGKYLEIIQESKKDGFLSYFNEENILHVLAYNELISVLLNIGLAYIELQQYDEALETYVSLTNVVKIFSGLFNRFALKQNKDADDQAVLDYLQKQKDRAKDNKKRYFANRAYVHYRIAQVNENKEQQIVTDNFKKAVKYYEGLIRNDNNEPNAHLGLARVYYEMKLAQEKTEFFKLTLKLLSQQSTDMLTLLGFCEVYYYLENYDRALYYAKRALDFPSVNICNKKLHAYNWLSRIAYKQNDYHLAVGFYEELIKCLIDDQSPCSFTEDKSVIIPKPELSDTFKYLSDNKKKIRDAEIVEQRQQLSESIEATGKATRESIDATLNSAQRAIYWSKFFFILSAVIYLCQILADHRHPIQFAQRNFSNVSVNCCNFVKNTITVQLKPKPQKTTPVADTTSPKEPKNAVYKH